ATTPGASGKMKGKLPIEISLVPWRVVPKAKGWLRELKLNQTSGSFQTSVRVLRKGRALKVTSQVASTNGSEKSLSTIFFTARTMVSIWCWVENGSHV